VSIAAVAPAGASAPGTTDAHASCFYEGSVRHRRHGALRDELHHRLCMAYLDLDELPELFDGHLLWSARRPALAWFRRSDYLGDPHTPLRQAVEQLVRERIGIALDGPIRLLTHMRFLGHCFNPVSFYYCFDADGEHVRAVVAEVTNTPWGERHAYVLPVDRRRAKASGDDDGNAGYVMRGEFAKALHVSPLMGMDHTYDWRLTEPGQRLSVHIESTRSGGPHDGALVFDATLSLRRRPITAGELRRVLVRNPLPTIRLTARIYAHALRLRLRGAHWHSHPRHLQQAADAQAAPSPPPALVDRLARRIVLLLLSRMRRGELVLVEGGQRLRFGKRGSSRTLSAELQIRSPRFYRTLLRGSLGLGEAYAGGLWDSPDLVSLTRLGARNMAGLDMLRRVFSPVLAPLQRTAGWLARNTPARARRRIAAHYDLGNELFSQFLDRTMMYSCAIFDSPAATLEQASLAKLERICTKLKLSPNDHVLEIGTGWGGFAEHAAAHYGCRVTTTTISAEQHAYATERVRDAGLADRVTVLFEDYRDPALDRHGPYDKLVSIEMIEAVGWQYFPTFFRRCSELVAEDGAMLLQAIVIEDRAYEVEKASKSFANTHIFPGGCLPSLRVIARNVARVTDFREAHLEDITAHYATTLQRWR